MVMVDGRRPVMTMGVTRGHTGEPTGGPTGEPTGGPSGGSIPDNVSLPEFLLARCDIEPDRMAFIDGDTGYSLTYRKYRDGVFRAAGALVRHGAMKGDVVIVCAPNSVQHVVMLLAIQTAGAVPSGINPTSTVDEIVRQASDSNAKFVVTSAEDIQKICLIQARCPRIKEVFTIGPVSGYTSVDELMDGTGDMALPVGVEISPRRNLGLLPYSSGTTGLPKGVMLTHYALVANTLLMLIEPSVHRRGDVMVSVFPTFHIGGFIESFTVPFYAISTVVFFKKFDFQTFLSANQRYKTTLIFAPPSVTLRLAKDPLVDKFDLSSVQRMSTGGAAISAATQKEALERLQVESFQMKFGMTEMAGSSHCTLHPSTGGFVFGSPGKCKPGIQQKIVSLETGVVLGPWCQGELCILTPSRMIGYLNQPEATAATLEHDGWLHTGDIGYTDESGNLYIVDRAKELIKYKGFQVAPAEIEALLLSHPDVADAAVLGVPDKVAGELPKAFIVLKPGRIWQPEKIQSYVKQRAAPYKQLRGGIERIDAIPKTQSGKILRRTLRLRTGPSKL